MLSRSRARAAVLSSALLAMFLVLVTTSPAQADPDRSGPSIVTPVGPSAADLSQSQEVQHPQPGHPGGTGNPGSGTGTGATGTGETAPPAENCGRYLGSTFVTEVCPEDPADPADPVAPVAPVITTEMVTEVARVSAPVTPPHVEPGNLSFVNIPNNFWADAPTVDDSVVLFGVTIPLRWTPTGTTWNFGDGLTATGNGVKGADVGAAGAVEHAYQRQGSYDISTTTTYDLTFVLPGGGSQTVSLVSTPSPAVTLPVREIQTLTTFAPR